MKQVLVLIFTCYTVLTAYSQELKWIKFNWVGSTSGGRHYEKVAIILPVQLNDMSYKFEMQFDLGASTSMVYGNNIAPYLQLNKNLGSKIDTSLKTWIDSKQYPTFKGVDIKLDNVTFHNINLGYYKNYGDSISIDSAKSNSVKTIGTIGYDFFDGKILVIDYPNSRIAVADAIPAEYLQRGSFSDCKFEDQVIMVPFKIGDKTVYLMFDTGSSRYALFTNEQSAREVAGKDATVIDSLQSRSWGKVSYVYGMKVKEEIKLGNEVMPSAIAYFKKSPWDYFFVSHNIWGITGNVFFLNDIVVLDFKNHKFGVVKSAK